jgi:glycosyltransferase involved in cell wall biosynthesis
MDSSAAAIGKLSVSVIVPCYNEEESIRETYRRIKASLMGSGAKNHEILFIDDGSKDRSFGMLRDIAKKDKKVRVLSLSRNFGHQAAVTAGIENSVGQVAIIIDADLQDPPELFGEMIRIHLEQGANTVYGQRSTRKGESFFKKASASLFYRILNFLSDEQKAPKDTGDFRLIDRKIIEVFKKMPERKEYLRGLISWIGFKTVALPYDRDERFAGETKYPLRKMLKFASRGITYFSTKPLRLATSAGLAAMAIGLLLAVYVIIAYFSKAMSIVPGWASTIITIVFFGGVQLLCLGILGSYLAIVLNEVKRRPQYIVGESVNEPKKR